MEKTRVTKKENFTELLGIVTELGREDLVKFIEREIELVSKKRANKGLTANQKANLESVEVIFGVIAEADKPLSIAEITAGDERLSTFSNQKMSALLKKLVEAGRVVRVTEKGKAFFSVAE